MKTTCRLIAVLLIMVLAISAAACSGGESNSKTDASVASTDKSKTETAETTAEAKVPETLIANTDAGRKTLVAYFSATGSTKRIAEAIASITKADLYEIVPAQPYSQDDLDYNNENSRAMKEQSDPAARPALAGEQLSLDEYSCIYVGYPIWCDQAPRLICTFLESYDFSTKTIIPFCTSQSSGIENSSNALSEIVKCKNWFKGSRFSADASDEEIRKLINGSNL